MPADVNLQAALEPNPAMGSELTLFRGYSAYEIAVQHGFEGTEADWLASLNATSATVNGQSRDENGDIKLYATHIPVSSEEGAPSVAQQLQNLSNGLATKISTQEAQAAIFTAVSVKASTASYTALFLASGWSESAPYSQTVSVEGILATDDPLVDVSLTGVTTAEAGKARTDAWTFVGRVEAGAGTVTACCYEEKPTVDLPVLLKVVR